MSLFNLAWKQWRQSPVPFESYASGAINAPTYTIELDLDHVRSAIVALASAHAEGREWDYGAMVQEELANLEHGELALARIGEDVPQTSRLRDWIRETRLLLLSFQDQLK